MPIITGGRVAYRRTIQPEPFESKTAEVEFTFTLTEDEDAAEAAADALATAKNEAHIALNIKASKAR